MGTLGTPHTGLPRQKQLNFTINLPDPAGFFLITVKAAIHSACSGKLPAAQVILNTAIIGAFRFLRKITGGKLSHSPMIMKAFAAYSLPAAGIGTVTDLFVLFNLAFHNYQLIKLQSVFIKPDCKNINFPVTGQLWDLY